MTWSSSNQIRRVSEGLYNDLLFGILQGEYPPSSTFPTEHKLARDYGVSRAVVRTALEVLKREGFVQSRQGSGTVVASLDSGQIENVSQKTQPQELRDCYACRLVIEPEIAALVTFARTQASQDFLGTELESLNAMLGWSGGQDRSQSANDADFHIRLAQLSGNVFFTTIMESMRPYMLFAMNFVKCMPEESRDSHLRLSLSEHHAIISAILTGQADDARTAMRVHIANGAQRIMRSG